jgi:hypothetical protein
LFNFLSRSFVGVVKDSVDVNDPNCANADEEHLQILALKGLSSLKVSFGQTVSLNEESSLVKAAYLTIEQAKTVKTGQKVRAWLENYEPADWGKDVVVRSVRPTIGEYCKSFWGAFTHG